MTISLVNRYKQMLSTIPKGSFYDSEGQVLPFRGESPYELRITTAQPNRQYGVFINDQYTTLITTNAQSVALIVTKLTKGRNDIRLVDSVDQTTTIAYITTRDYATILAAEAQVVEGIDTGVEQVLLDSHLATSSIGLIEQVFGKTVETGNNFGYDLDTYRELLGELRTAYRYWGGTTEGIARAVRGFTQISPLVYPASFGPRWILGKDILSPKNSTSSRTYYSTSALTNFNANGAGATLTFQNTNGVGTGILKRYSSGGFGVIKNLTWTPPNGVEGAQVNISAILAAQHGSATLYGADYFDPIVGFPGPYNIIASRNDVFTLDIDGHGLIDITLTTGGARTAAQIATDVNTVLAADLRYGVGYNAVADSYDAFTSGTPMIRLTTPNGASGGLIKLMPRTGADATQTLFDLPIIRGGLANDYAIGATSIILGATTDMTSWPSPTVDNPIKVVMGGTLFNPTGTPSTTTTITAAEVVTVTAVDHASKTLTLQNPLTIAHNRRELAYVQGEWPYLRTSAHNSRGVTITIGNGNLGTLPGNTTDNVVISGTGAPDGWIVTTNAGAAVTPTPYAMHSYFELDRDVSFDLNANGMVTLPVPDEILKYKGFDIDITIWGRIDDPSRAATQSTINSIDLSFDNQVSYTSAAPVVSGPAVNSEWRPRQYTRVIRVPVDATKMWVRVKLSGAGVGNFTIHKVRVTVPGIHDGLFLGDGTIPRGESKIKQGNFMYVWSNDQLSSYEDASLGLTNVTQVNPGHIDKIAPTQAWLEKFDVSEYDGSGNAINIKGVFTETDIIAGISTNLDLVLRTPPRFSHLKPHLLNDTTQTVVFNPTPAYTGTLTIASNQDITTSILTQDGVPLTKDTWQYNSSTQIELLIPPSPSSVYSFTYEALLRFESTSIDLGTTYANYIWFVDYDVWQRPEIKPTIVSITSGIQFDVSGIASLDERSIQDKSSAALIEDTGLTQRIIPSSQWNFLDASRIQIDLGVFNTQNIYSFRYMSETNHPDTDVIVKVEHKAAATGGALGAATYSEIVHNQVIDGSLRYHQMRVTLSGVRDIRDARIQSLVLKGLNAFGIGGTIPVLRP